VMPNMRTRYIDTQRITEVVVTPVTKARSGRKWTTMNGVDFP